jgi:hypothetical protein
LITFLTAGTAASVDMHGLCLLSLIMIIMIISTVVVTLCQYCLLKSSTTDQNITVNTWHTYIYIYIYIYFKFWTCSISPVSMNAACLCIDIQRLTFQCWYSCHIRLSSGGRCQYDWLLDGTLSNFKQSVTVH